MSNTSASNKFPKITNYTRRIARSTTPVKRPISPTSTTSYARETKRPNTMDYPDHDKSSTENSANLVIPSPADQDSPINIVENNKTIQQVLGPLVTEFKLLRESVNTVHSDYKDLKHVITKQKDEIKHELINKIDKNNSKLVEISQENRILRKENESLKSRLDRIEQNQLSNNVMITGIPEGPYEQYGITKLRVQEMIAVTIDSGDREDDLIKAKEIDITSCNRVGRYKHNVARPISVTFATRDDKEAFLSGKRKLPSGVFANDELPPHVKKRRDRLLPIYHLAKSLPEYRDKCRLTGDKLVINGTSYRIEDIPKLPPDLAAFKSSEKSNDTHLVFAGELSPYSNFYPSPFIINGQTYHSSEQWVQYQKALMFGDSYTANLILQTDTALECKRLSHNINGVDNEKWKSVGYELCFDGIKEKFLQNPPLLAMLKTTAPKTLAEATLDKLWGTGIRLRDRNALDTEKWLGAGWLSKMLITIRDKPN